MEQDIPIGTVYRETYATVKDKLMKEDGEFYPGVAVKVMARMHTARLKGLIDDDMSDSDENKLNNIVERSIVKYVDADD